MTTANIGQLETGDRHFLQVSVLGKLKHCTYCV
jgi:hypothetical protein